MSMSNGVVYGNIFHALLFNSIGSDFPRQYFSFPLLCIVSPTHDGGVQRHDFVRVYLYNILNVDNGDLLFPP